MTERWIFGPFQTFSDLSGPELTQKGPKQVRNRSETVRNGQKVRVRSEKSESPLGLGLSDPADRVTDDMFSGRYEPMPDGPTIATEVWISRRLRRFDLFAGVTDPDQRRELVRAAILGGRMGMAVAGKRAGKKVETWGELFQRVYGQPLGDKVAA